MRKSWITTGFGLLGCIGTFLAGVDDPAWLASIGKFLAAISIFLLGKNARDRNVTSEMENGTG